MTYFDSLWFVYSIILTRFDLSAWIWAIAVLFGSLFFLNFLWGFCWNKQWTIFRLRHVAVASIIIALLCAVSTLALFAADRSIAWLELQRTELTRQFIDSGTRNRRIFVAARERIEGRDTSAAENVLVLRNNNDLLTLASVAASDVKCPLTSSGPLGPGAPCRVRDPITVANEVVRNIAVPSYPIKVSPQNSWTEAAVKAQLEEAMSYATTRLRAGMTELREDIKILLIVLTLVQILIVSIAAVMDIRVNPSV